MKILFLEGFLLLFSPYFLFTPPAIHRPTAVGGATDKQTERRPDTEAAPAEAPASARAREPLPELHPQRRWSTLLPRSLAETAPGGGK